MCGRFATRGKAREIARQLGIDEIDLPERYNVAPTTFVLAAVADPAPRWTLLRWGLIPGWAKDISIGSRLINARAESIQEKASFRSSFKRRRCLIPCLGYYEWQRFAHHKQPWFHTYSDDRLIVMAGIWDHWQSPDGSELESFSLITTDSNSIAAQVHHRMPVLLSSQNWSVWMDHSSEKTNHLIPLLGPGHDPHFQTYRVSTSVNSVRNDSPTLIHPLPDSSDLFPDT